MGTTRVKVIDLSSDQKEDKPKKKMPVVVAAPKIEKPETQTENLKTVKSKTDSTEEDFVPKIKVIETEESEKTKTPTDSKTGKQEVKIGKKEAEKAKSSAPKKVRGKNYQNAKSQVENKTYSAKEAITLLSKTSFVKFDPTVEIHLSTSEKNLQGSVKLPHAVTTKKQKKFLVFAEKGESEDKNIIWGTEKTIEDIGNGTLKPQKDFDIVYTTAKFMPSLAKVAKVLGPKGLMPNPKNHTIISNAKELDTKGQEGVYEYRSDPSGNAIHAKLGKLSVKSESLEENLKTLVLAIGPSKIKTATLTSTMGPAIKVDISKI